MASLFSENHYPAGREIKPRDQPMPGDTPVPDSNGPSPNANDVPVSGTDPNSPPTPADHFVPSSALNNPQPWTTQTPGPSSTDLPSSGLPVLTSITLSTGPLQPTPAAASIQGSRSLGSSSNKKYIIGGAVGGGVLVLILLGLILFYCSKRRRRRDLERSGGDHSEGRDGYGQFDCCSHGTCNKNVGQLQTDQKTPLKPFVLKSDSVAPIPRGRPHQPIPSLKRRDSTGSQESVGSDYSTETLCSSDSEGSQGGRGRSQKRPPPLKLTSLVTPVINGPQNNPRKGADHSLPSSPHEVPAIVVDPPRSARPRLRRH